jgi:hypothetical protein
MQTPFTGVINVDVRDSTPDWAPFEPPRAPDGAPNRARDRQLQRAALPRGRGRRHAGGRDRPALRLLVLHDDPEREFDYTAGAEKSLETAAARGWTVVSIKNDWKAVFADGPA